jgi:hypothetical protein
MTQFYVVSAASLVRAPWSSLRSAAKAVPGYIVAQIGLGRSLHLAPQNKVRTKEQRYFIGLDKGGQAIRSKTREARPYLRPRPCRRDFVGLFLWSGAYSDDLKGVS